MDRDELQDRIRARRSGGDPYRRGGVADGTETGYERFEPEPEDSQARRARRPAERRQDSLRDAAPVPVLVAEPEPDAASQSLVPPIAARPDITRDVDDWAARPATDPTPTPLAPPPSDVPVEEVAYVDNFDDETYADDAYPYAYDEWDEGGRRGSSGAGAFAILGFLALGVLALLGGAVLAGVFGDDPNAGATDPTPSPSPVLSESIAPSGSASAAPSAATSTDPSASAAASGEPVVFPDGFTAEAEPCLPGTMRRDGSGCDSNGSTNAGTVEIYVGFRSGTSDDVIGAEIVGPDGAVVGDGSIDLSRINCGQTCNGWTFFSFANLGPGTYEVRITRNGEFASETGFEVS
ncbi:MAG: hypothetical protein H0U86_04025 [Chloroflexi bacterium]|nr:hypothetical protein [Chloroflexota bacterium]